MPSCGECGYLGLRPRRGGDVDSDTDWQADLIELPDWGREDPFPDIGRVNWGTKTPSPCPMSSKRPWLGSRQCSEVSFEVKLPHYPLPPFRWVHLRLVAREFGEQPAVWGQSGSKPDSAYLRLTGGVLRCLMWRRGITGRRDDIVDRADQITNE